MSKFRPFIPFPWGPNSDLSLISEYRQWDHIHGSFKTWTHHKLDQAEAELGQAQTQLGFAYTRVDHGKIKRKVYCISIYKVYRVYFSTKKSITRPLLLEIMIFNQMVGWGKIEIKDHLSPAKAETGAELGNYRYCSYL